MGKQAKPKRSGSARGCPTFIVLVVALVLLILAFSAPTSLAAVRTASVSLPAPYQPPSLGPQTPVVDTEPYLHTAAISHDDVAGTVTGSMSLYDPSYWASQPSDSGRFDNWTLHITLATDCTIANGALTDSTDAIELGFAMGPAMDSNYTYASAWTGATLTGYQGQLNATGTFDGTTYTGTLQSNAFANRDFRCVRFQATDNDTRSDQANWYDAGWGWIPGYAPVTTLLNPWARTFSMRPAWIGLSGDGSSFIAGTNGHGPHIGRNWPRWAGHIVWSSWTQTQAIGSGANWIDNCQPDCAGGHYYAYPVQLRAYAPDPLGRFTRLLIRRRYHGRRQTHIWKLVHNGSWYWSW